MAWAYNSTVSSRKRTVDDEKVCFENRKLYPGGGRERSYLATPVMLLTGSDFSDDTRMELFPSSLDESKLGQKNTKLVSFRTLHLLK